MGGEPETPFDAPESRWAELGLRAIGRMPRAGDLVAFRAEQKLLRVAAVGPETVALEVVQAAPGDETEIGTRIEKTLRDYLEAWGEGTFSAPNADAETSSSAAPPGAETTRGAAELTGCPSHPRPSFRPAAHSAGGRREPHPFVSASSPRCRGGHLGPQRGPLAAHRT